MTQFLTLEEVEHHVSCLPRRTLESLAAGPIEPDDGSESPDGELCRLCMALDELDADRLAGRVHARTWCHALALRAWHEVLITDLAEYVDAAHPDGAYDFADLIEDTGGRAMRAFGEVMGALSYARCAVVYTAARNQLGALRAGVYAT